MTTSLLNNQPNNQPADGEKSNAPQVPPVRRILFSLGGRLSLCAEMIRPMCSLADVGTDHAYLPVWLARKDRISKAVATDIRPGPLSRARENILRYGVDDRISVRLTDGLSGISPEDADDIVIAGMGGKMMIHIVSEAGWLKNNDKHLILQLMTSVEDLRAFLADSGFAVLREQAAEEEGHIYTVMLVSYDPGLCKKDDLSLYIGKIDASTSENRNYLAKQITRLFNRASGLRTAGKIREAEEDLRRIERIKARFPACFS